VDLLPRIQIAIERRPDDFEAYQDYFDALRSVGETDKPSAYKSNLWLRGVSANAVRRLSDAKQIERFFDLNKKTYLYSARDCFEDYMIYLEWNRDPAKRFYVPRQKTLRPIVLDMQRLIDDELDLLSISLPPGTGKTTLQIFLHSWLMGRNPDKPNLASGHSGMLTNSVFDGVSAVLFDKSEFMWGDVFPETKDIITNAKEQTIDINKKHRFSSLTCRAIGASLTGATRCEGLLTADDLVSGIEEALSKDRLDKKWDAYNNDLKSRKKLNAKELHLATRWSVHDVIGRLERQYAGNPRAKFIVIPALNSGGESNFNYKYGVGFDAKYFNDMRDSLDDASFRALYMNEPIEREGLLYHRDDLRRFYELPTDEYGRTLEPDAIIGICDTAEGGGDDTFLPVGMVYGQDHYICDCVCSNALPEITDNLCADILITNKVQMCEFESNAAGGRTADKVQEKVKARGGKTHIRKKRTTANKETKIIVNSPWVKEHCLFWTIQR
jgi:predicted phage terminase large subunit-like protein